MTEAANPPKTWLDVTKRLIDMRERLDMYLDKPTDLRLFLLRDCRAILNELLHRPAATPPPPPPSVVPKAKGHSRTSLRPGFLGARIVRVLASQPPPAKGMTAIEIARALGRPAPGCKYAIEGLLRRAFIVRASALKPFRYGVTDVGLAALKVVEAQEGKRDQAG